MRAIIDLPENQVLALEAQCARAGISRAEAVRRAVGQYIQQDIAVHQSQKNDSSHHFANAFGLWKHKAQQNGAQKTVRPMVDGVAYQQLLRADWDA